MMSLFSGSGGFELAATLCGIEPVYGSEIEPYPIAVTRSRFPNMKHLGSVTDVKGDEIEPVDVITFGSPCQDLSVAGKRAGLKHEDNGDDETTRSGLFMEAIRIIKEMREATNGVYPRIALWENVPGAFSSNKGEDFRIVLEEFVKIVEPTAVMPSVPKKGWAYADCYRGNGWSLAYRVLDAQYWGVPQRRRRIYLVADFTGECAGEILFKREGLRGYFEESRAQRKETSGYVDESIGTTDGENECVAYSFDSTASNSMKSDNPHSGCRRVDIAKTLDTTQGNPSRNQGGIAILEPIAVATQQGGAEVSENGICPTITAAAGMSGNNQPWIAKAYSVQDRAGKPGGGKGMLVQEDRATSLRTSNYQFIFQPICYDARGNGDGEISPTITGDHNNRITDYTTIVLEGNGSRPSHHGDGYIESDKMYTLNTIERHAVAYERPVEYDRAMYNQGQNALYEPQTFEDGTVPTLVARGPSGVAYSTCMWDGTQIAPTPTANNAGGNQRMPDKDNFNSVIEYREPQYIVRRLTPTECARLQGFPDWWGHIDHKDDFTDEEYEFWLNVRNTHAEINGKQTKGYTKKQILTWYNKLHTDSAEYKLWGNGIALPTALYVMQGIAELYA